MAKNQKALKRYLIILRMLSSNEKHSSKRIHQACLNSGINVAYRTIQKDLEDLRDDDTIFGKKLGIIKDIKEKKWYSNGIPKEIFSALELKEGEVDALLFYTKIINQYKDYPIFKDISQAMKKVIDGSNISKDRKVLFNLENLIEPEKHPPTSGIEFIIDLLQAISKRNVIEIEYGRFGKNSKIHIVKPILLKEDKLMWYLIGINIKYDSLITLALDRVISVLIKDEKFNKIEFNSSEYFKHSFGITVSDKAPIEVLISFEPKQGNYLKTLPIHSTQTIIEETEKQLIIKIIVKPSYEFFSKIYSYGSTATIISPKEIKSIFINDLEKGLARYKLAK